MRRITTLILGFLLTSSLCLAQGEINETFDAEAGWTVSGGEAVEKTEDGMYTVKNKERYTYIRSQKEIGSISDGADFMVSVKAQLHHISYSGGDNQYGVAIGDSEMNSYYVLAVNNDTTYALAEVLNGDTLTYVDWTKHYIVKPDTRQNELTIVKENQMVYYQINGYNIYKKDFAGIYGNNVALLTGIKSTVSFDEVNAMVSSPMEVNVASDAVKEEDYVLENLGGMVNSCFTEILPRLSNDETQLYITRMDHPENLGDETNSGDIWVSAAATEEEGENGEEMEADMSDEEMMEEESDWEMVTHLGNVVNNSNDGNTNFIVSFAPDGESMYLKGLYGEYHPIYESTKEGDGWSVPQPMKMDDYYNLSDEINIASTPDREAVIISIERLDSKGGRDLYYSQRTDSTWTKPLNLGDVINTYGDDISPFLAEDGKTLYYATQGKPGYGGYDLFKTVRQSDDWTDWSEPENLGEVINSEQDDRDYYIPPTVEEDGTQAYLSSSVLTEGAYGGLDIYALVPAVIEEPVRRNFAGEQIRVNFDFDKADIRQEDAQGLDLGIARLNQGSYEIEIAGHTDYIGTDAYNQQLSERRAESVYNYLTRNGLDLEKVKIKQAGYGEKYPCDTNRTNEGRFNNRRVLIVILGETDEGKTISTYTDVYEEGNCGTTSFSNE